VFEHMQAGHAGIFCALLREQGIAWRSVRFDLGEPIPDLETFDALWVMGGPMDVWQEAEYPWLVSEKAAIREAVVDRAMPYLGICLGHQLLADALGGIVQPAARPEVGVFEIARTPAGEVHALLDGLPQRPRVLQWHTAEVIEPPEGAAVLDRLRRAGDGGWRARPRAAVSPRGRPADPGRLAVDPRQRCCPGQTPRPGRSARLRQRSPEPHGGVQQFGSSAAREFLGAAAGAGRGALTASLGSIKALSAMTAAAPANSR
jgi:GMP synthase-like glutamine amidotransferase